MKINYSIIFSFLFFTLLISCGAIEKKEDDKNNTTATSPAATAEKSTDEDEEEDSSEDEGPDPVFEIAAGINSLSNTAPTYHALVQSFMVSEQIEIKRIELYLTKLVGDDNEQFYVTIEEENVTTGDSNYGDGNGRHVVDSGGTIGSARWYSFNFTSETPIYLYPGQLYYVRAEYGFTGDTSKFSWRGSTGDVHSDGHAFLESGCGTFSNVNAYDLAFKLFDE